MKISEEQLGRVLIPEIRDKLITMAMGKCWHKHWSASGSLYICESCGIESRTKFNPSYFFNAPGWFSLFNWLTKEKRKWWIPFFEWVLNDAQDLRISRFKAGDFGWLVENLPDLFVRWIIETETGMWEECLNYHHRNYCIGVCLVYAGCHNTGKILTPLGELIKEIMG
jgi:hypothetical protein